MSARMDDEGIQAAEEEEARLEEGDFDFRQWQTEEVIDRLRFPPLMIHLALVLIVVWIVSLGSWDLRFVFALGFAYICYIESRQRRKIETMIRSEEQKSTDRKRLLSDAETARWLDSVVKSMWPIFLRQFASEHFLMVIAPWFLEHYRPWTAKQVVIQKLYLGKSPPKFSFVRAGRHDPTNGDHMVLEMTVNFEASKDMHAVMAVQMRKRLGLGLWTSIHVSGLQMEGKLKLGFKFVNGWPAIERLRICFSEPPTIRMVATPVFSSGVDVTDLPGIESWMHKMINDALQHSLVEPHQLTVDVEKLVGDLMATYAEDGHSGKNQNPGSTAGSNLLNVKMLKGSFATVLVEILKAEKLRPGDANGKSDPYVKITSGKVVFKTSIKERTLQPQWYEQFYIPIMDWDSPLKFRVRDKDRFFDDELGYKEIILNEELRDGQRHEMWVQLDGVKTGRLHIALTVQKTSIVDTSEGSLSVHDSVHDSLKGEDVRKGPGSSTPSPPGSAREGSKSEDIDLLQVDKSSSVPNSCELVGENNPENGDHGVEGLHSPKDEKSKMKKVGRGVVKRMEKTAHNITHVLHRSLSPSNASE